jgi:rod shape-determining protein MreD
MIVLLVLAIQIQLTVPSSGWLGEARVPAVLAVVLYYALQRPLWLIMLACVVGGLLVDSQSIGLQLGVFVFFFCVTALIANRFRDLVFNESLLTAACFGAASAVVINVAVWLVLMQDGSIHAPVWWAGLKIFGSGVLGMLVTPLFFLLGRGLDVAVGNVLIGQEIDGKNQSI